MMIEVNGRRHELPAGTTLWQVLDERGATRQGVAVAIDGNIVARGDWRRTQLHDGASIEVLTAVQGG